MNTDDSSNLSVAIDAARRSFPVLPLCYPDNAGACVCPGERLKDGTVRPHEGKNIGKAPIGSLVSKGVDSATTNTATITRWWGQYPQANVGIDLGRAALLFVDPDSAAALDDARERGLPATATRYSRNVGYLYRRPKDCPAFRVTKVGTSRALDILSAGYAVVHGRHANGTRVFVEGFDDLAPAPAWAVELVVERAQAVVDRKARVKRRAAAPAAGGEPPVRLIGKALKRWSGKLVETGNDGQADRSKSLFLLGRVLFDAGASRDTVVAALAERDASLGWRKYSDRADGGEVNYSGIVDELERTGRTPVIRIGSDTGSAYVAGDGGLYWNKKTGDGAVPIRLTNFTARIVADVVKDDGAESRREIEIEGSLRGRTSRFLLPADSFHVMAWPIKYLGSGAVVEPGFGLRDRARAAIQELSGEVSERTVYAHVGWRTIDGRHAYLHAGGALGAAGPIDGVEVSLGPPVDRYALPTPPAGVALAAAVRASLHVLDVAPDCVTVPSLGAAYRAALGRADFGLFIAGQTGLGKSELAALVQQHFGAGMDRQNLPGTWSSTGNALESLAFLAKDAVLVVDDFAPTGSQTDVQRFHRDADRLLRAQGNSAGRHRLRSDTSVRAARAPRGIVISTGEDVPRGQSARARVLIIEIEKGMIRLSDLTAHQEAAASGRFAEAMAGYVCWLAGRAGELEAAWSADVKALRSAARGSGSHARTPEIVANLATGWRWWLSYAVDAGALTQSDASALWLQVWAALGKAAAAQVEHQRGSEPTVRFLELVASAVATGRAHIANPNGDPPARPEAWGWRQRTFGTGDYARDEWQPQGRRIGWVDDAGLYLDPEGSFVAAQEIGNVSGDPLPILQKTLAKRLCERGLLVAAERERGRNTVRRELDGQRRNVLHLGVGILEAGAVPESTQSTQSARAGEDTTLPHWSHANTGPILGADSGGVPSESAQKIGPNATTDQSTPDAGGPIGSVGPIPDAVVVSRDAAHSGPTAWRCSGCRALERQPHDAGGWRCAGCGSLSDDAGRVVCASCSGPAEDGQRRNCLSCLRAANGAA